MNDLERSGVTIWNFPVDSEQPTAARSSQKEHDALRRLAAVFGSSPSTILQELLDVALDLCNCDSAGISLLENTADGSQVFRWVATAGSFKQFAQGTTPANFSPCGVCLERNAPQRFQVSKPYYDLLGIEAEPIHDGILIPWHIDDADGTIWIVSHDGLRHFGIEDLRFLQTLADCVAIALRQRRSIHSLRETENLATRIKLINDLAHKINNPLQALTNVICLAQIRPDSSQAYLGLAADELKKLSSIVQQILAP